MADSRPQRKPNACGAEMGGFVGGYLHQVSMLWKLAVRSSLVVSLSIFESCCCICVARVTSRDTKQSMHVCEEFLLHLCGC